MEHRQKTIVVALQKDARDQKLLAAAKSLADKLACKLHLVHSYEPRLGVLPSPIFGEEYHDLLATIYDSGFAETEQEIGELAATVGATFRVLVGAPCPALVAEARSAKAWLMMVGSRGHSHRFLPKGLSVPLSLFNASPCPVLVVSDSAEVPWQQESAAPSDLAVFAADDLSAINPTAFAAELSQATQEGGGPLQVVHVNPMTKDTIEAGIAQAAAAAHSAAREAYNASEIYEHINRRICEVMKDRVPLALRTRVTPEFTVLHGEPIPELLAEIERRNPSIVVFGKHQAWHHKPFYFGQVPFSTAFQLNRPFIVVPG